MGLRMRKVIFDTKYSTVVTDARSFANWFPLFFTPNIMLLYAKYPRYEDHLNVKTTLLSPMGGLNNEISVYLY